MRTLTTRKGRSIETPHTDNEALVLLRKLISQKVINGGGFAGDLSIKADGRYGLSKDQWTWVHILVVEAEQPQAPRAGNGEQFTKLVEFFDHAGMSLKRPAVTFGVAGGNLRIKRAGDKSAHAGCLFLDNCQPWGASTRKYYGKIDTGGAFYPSKQVTEELVAEIRRFQEDPATYAAAHGKATGHCCFCNTKIEHPDSLAVGYGPICAKNYGLPHGGSGITNPTNQDDDPKNLCSELEAWSPFEDAVTNEELMGMDR
jgi:hypothetical protein